MNTSSTITNCTIAEVNTLTIQAPPIKFGAPLIGYMAFSKPLFNEQTQSEHLIILSYDQANRCFLLYNVE